MPYADRVATDQPAQSASLVRTYDVCYAVRQGFVVSLAERVALDPSAWMPSLVRVALDQSEWMPSLVRVALDPSAW